MNRWGYQQKALMRGCVVDSGVVCPQPRRIGVPLQFHEPVKAGTELLDIIRMTGTYCSERSGFQVASSPPFFAGTPPSRVSNPLIQDEKFTNNNGYPLTPRHDPPPSTRRSGSCIETNFSSKPAVRVEGFNCCGDSRISAIA